MIPLIKLLSSMNIQFYERAQTQSGETCKQYMEAARLRNFNLQINKEFPYKTET